MDFDKFSNCLLFPFPAEQPDLRVRKRLRHTYWGFRIHIDKFRAYLEYAYLRIYETENLCFFHPTHRITTVL